MNQTHDMANEEEAASIRAPEPVTITVVRCKNLVRGLAKTTLIILFHFKLVTTTLVTCGGDQFGYSYV